MTEFSLSPAARAEGHRLTCSFAAGNDEPLEHFTCFDCDGAKLRSEVPPEQLIEWADLLPFNRRARTLCALAWDGYNTNGDCLASK